MLKRLFYVDPFMRVVGVLVCFFIKALDAVAWLTSGVVERWLSYYRAKWIGINLARMDRRKLMIIYTDDIIRLHAVLRF